MIAKSAKWRCRAYCDRKEGRAFKEPMVELKILERNEAVAKRLQGHDAIVGDIFEIPPKKAVKLIERGVARTASWTDFEENTSPFLDRPCLQARFRP
ncbi:hypothetical protein AKJ61_02915 [candidate division MSBL1 archaeon SCGC-AAA259B11]|uniref:Uncharacterized protein n=1 Tax=candidate division MSBL1 archaeon SCGC-AAA259B11 TaxID=1698260 RepID=A0A133U5E5_9EURY|nr:hypothetical protein AKJ61_02915 [candidate division MSBL1 archaeon SCGC-AAA259B11]